VKDRGLWAAHLGPDWEAWAYGQLKLALMNEVMARSPWGPRVFGAQAPDTGNAEILATYGHGPSREPSTSSRSLRVTSSRASQ